MLLLRTALPDLTSRAKPHWLHSPTPASPHRDSIHAGARLCWRCELYERLRLIVKTKKRFIYKKNRFISPVKRAPARLNRAHSSQLPFFVDVTSSNRSSESLYCVVIEDTLAALGDHFRERTSTSRFSPACARPAEMAILREPKKAANPMRFSPRRHPTAACDRYTFLWESLNVTCAQRCKFSSSLWLLIRSSR